MRKKWLEDDRRSLSLEKRRTEEAENLSIVVASSSMTSKPKPLFSICTRGPTQSDGRLFFDEELHHTLYSRLTELLVARGVVGLRNVGKFLQKFFENQRLYQ